MRSSRLFLACTSMGRACSSWVRVTPRQFVSHYSLFSNTFVTSCISAPLSPRPMSTSPTDSASSPGSEPLELLFDSKEKPISLTSYPVPVHPRSSPPSCSSCNTAMKPAVLTSFDKHKSEEENKEFGAYPLAVDGFVCESCHAISYPIKLTDAELEEMLEKGTRAAAEYRWSEAEYYFRRVIYASPISLNPRLSLGLLLLERIYTPSSVNVASRHSQWRDEVIHQFSYMENLLLVYAAAEKKIPPSSSSSTSSSSSSSSSASTSSSSSSPSFSTPSGEPRYDSLPLIVWRMLGVLLHERGGKEEKDAHKAQEYLERYISLAKKQKEGGNVSCIGSKEVLESQECIQEAEELLLVLKRKNRAQ